MATKRTRRYTVFSYTVVNDAIIKNSSAGQLQMNFVLKKGMCVINQA